MMAEETRHHTEMHAEKVLGDISKTPERLGDTKDGHRAPRIDNAMVAVKSAQGGPARADDRHPRMKHDPINAILAVPLMGRGLSKVTSISQGECPFEPVLNVCDDNIQTEYSVVDEQIFLDNHFFKILVDRFISLLENYHGYPTPVKGCETAKIPDAHFNKLKFGNDKEILLQKSAKRESDMDHNDYVKLSDNFTRAILEKEEEMLRRLIEVALQSFNDDPRDRRYSPIKYKNCKEINELCMSLMSGNAEMCLSVDNSPDCICESVFQKDCPSSQNDQDDLPPHRLFLKRGIPLILTSTISEQAKLCEGTRLILKDIMLDEGQLRCTVVDGRNSPDVFIPRLKYLAPAGPVNDPSNGWMRWQFPVELAFATTNK